MPDSSVPPNRERGDFIGDDLSGIHTCHAGCPCQNRATGEDCPDCGGSGVKGENPIGLSRSCLKCGGSGRATPSTPAPGVRECERPDCTYLIVGKDLSGDEHCVQGHIQCRPSPPIPGEA
jgi:hypothetical protein